MKPERAREIATDFSRLATGTLSPQNLRLNSDGSFYDPDMLRLFEQAILQACAEERDKWIKGAKISIPSDTMEQEFSTHYRRGYAKGKEDQREEDAKICDELARTYEYPAFLCAKAIRKEQA